MIGLLGIWILCGLVGVGLVLYNELSNKYAIITIGDISGMVLVFIMGPIALIAGALWFLIELINDNSDRIIWRRKVDEEFDPEI